MSLYDIIDEMGAKQAQKTETGDARIAGVVVGIVAKNYDKDMPGRVCVTIPSHDAEANELQWARLVQPSSGSGWGHYFLPEVGDQVLLAFEGGHIERPYIIGCIPKDNNKFLSGSVDEHNKVKRIVTRHGSTIQFEDEKEGDGEKDKITVQTAGMAHTLLLDNENNIVRLCDKEKGNMLEIKTQDGNMAIKAKSKLVIQVGNTVTLTLNGESGAVKIEANELNIAVSGQLKAKADGMLSLEGATVSQKASSMFKLESSGMAQIAGSPIKIG